VKDDVSCIDPCWKALVGYEAKLIVEMVDKQMNSMNDLSVMKVVAMLLELSSLGNNSGLEIIPVSLIRKY
jgi:hypothetical protein